jgi:hypothetical protein
MFYDVIINKWFIITIIMFSVSAYPLAMTVCFNFSKLSILPIIPVTISSILLAPKIVPLVLFQF